MRIATRIPPTAAVQPVQRWASRPGSETGNSARDSTQSLSSLSLSGSWSENFGCCLLPYYLVSWSCVGLNGFLKLLSLQLLTIIFAGLVLSVRWSLHWVPMTSYVGQIADVSSLNYSKARLLMYVPLSPPSLLLSSPLWSPPPNHGQGHLLVPVIGCHTL